MPARIALFIGLFVLTAAPAAWAEHPAGLPWHRLEQSDSRLRLRASVQGKYRNLLRVIACPMDRTAYQDFHDYGYYTGSEWQGHKNLPAGHWVYVYPKWYIWGEKVK